MCDGSVTSGAQRSRSGSRGTQSQDRHKVGRAAGASSFSLISKTEGAASSRAGEEAYQGHRKARRGVPRELRLHRATPRVTRAELPAEAAA
ncbi:hypothetical protein EYF80_058962 [Liparis tanakae]|uniref:Uncharacterized protein n=1 Tax=Liparis tanakae TaxID=230148 RepID=A0A4Z2EPQ1_9TELE|nr:hypothetical protein EYF80_058962 [Liparis tanakae]